MIVDITNDDIELCKEKYKKQYAKLYLLDDTLTPIAELEGDCISGDISIDANSEIRRTCNIVLYSKDKTYVVSEYNRIWFNKRVKIQLGYETPTSTTKWYDMGVFIFNNCSYTYSGDTKTISIQCSDLTTMLDGTHGGVLDGPAFLIEEGNDIKKVIEDLIKVHTNIQDFYVATMGEYGCLQDKSISWKQNRMDSGSSLEVVNLQEKDKTDYLTDSPYLDDYMVTAYTSNSDLFVASTDENVVSGVEPSHYIDMGSWHVVPYDLEFSCGTPIYEMLVKLRDLYLGYESYFDTDGHFIVDLIPTCEHDPILLDYYDLGQLVIDESFNIDFSTIKNATRIYGKSIEVDRYADEESVVLKPYTEDDVSGYMIEINLDKFILSSNLKVGFKMPEYDKNIDTSLPLFVHVNAYESTISTVGEIIEKYTPTTISCTTRENIINVDETSTKSETVYIPINLSSFEPGESYCFKYISNQNTFMYLGMYQIEAYIEDNSEESPFAIDKIGTKLQVLSGGEYDDIPDVILCKERAEYENWLAGRFNDTISLTSVIIPFLDVNQKIRYRAFSNGEINQYILKNISYSLLDSTCNITMCRFYDLYPFIICASNIIKNVFDKEDEDLFYAITNIEESNDLQ